MINILLVLAIVILVLWLLGRIFFKSLGCMIHIALIIAGILLVIWLLSFVFHLF
jgi:hypothetical protein